MNLRTPLLAAAFAATACSIAVPSQFSCPEPGKATGCGARQVCGPDKLCTTLVDCLKTETRCNGVCTDVTHSRENCGACGSVCKPSEQCLPDAHNNPGCTPFCAAGQTACAQTAGGFVCENLSNDRSNCGTCGNTCPQGQVCTPPSPGQPGHCALECVPGFANCSANCLDLNSDDASCGACGNACSTGTHCVGGHCNVICTPGQTECTSPTGQKTCVDTTRDRDNCGGCGFPCAGGQICTNSSCQVSCQPGKVNCGGTCIDPQIDRNFCGAILDCTATNAGTTCSNGQICVSAGGSASCQLRCPAGETVCGFPAWNPTTPYAVGNSVTNGSNLYVAITAGISAASGGPSGAGASIADGAAVWRIVSATPPGGNLCIGLQSDRYNCGACNDATNSKTCGDGQICLGGACVVSCAPGLTQCNGACVDTHNDPAHCGTCGTSCSAALSAGPVCGAGVCGVSCPAGETKCGSKCVDPSSDPNNCGTGLAACGVACAAGQVCKNGGCTLTCPTGSVACSGKCIDPLHDNNNCGTGAAACGHPCASGQICASGVCSTTCSPPLSQCSSGTSAYCANLSYDPANCGTCGTPCASHPNASVYCASGTCAATCSGTFAHCTTLSTDVCETNLSSAAAHCGTCTNSCLAADNANPACLSSSCSTSCQTGFLDCDLDATTGCEADKVHDAANCGACGTLCSGTTPYCASGCVGAAALLGVQENLSLTAIQADWGLPCFTESYSHVGTTLAVIQTACPALTGQVLVACAAPGAPTLLVAAAGLRATVFTAGGTASGIFFYLPATGPPAFGFTPGGATTSFASFDLGGTTADGFVAGAGSQRISWPMQSSALTAGGRCGDRVGSSATSNYQRLVFTK